MRRARAKRFGLQVSCDPGFSGHSPAFPGFLARRMPGKARVLQERDMRVPAFPVIGHVGGPGLQCGPLRARSIDRADHAAESNRGMNHFKERGPRVVGDARSQFGIVTQLGTNIEHCQGHDDVIARGDAFDRAAARPKAQPVRVESL